jgi:hypothetical protein
VIAFADQQENRNFIFSSAAFAYLTRVRCRRD